MPEEAGLSANVGDRVVSVQVLRVDGRKLTLQFFRQIPREDWLDQRLQPRTDIKIWGRVHYAIKDEGVDWLLAQAGDRLIRCRFDRMQTSDGNVQMWRGWHERAVEKVAKLAAEAADKVAAAEGETREPVKKALQSNADMWSRWLTEAKEAEAKARADLDRQIELARQYEARTSQIDRLAPAVEQLFIG